jgi:hypothetical protein
VFSNSSWSAPILGRSSVNNAGSLEIVESLSTENIAAAGDGRAPHFENMP